MKKPVRRAPKHRGLPTRIVRVGLRAGAATALAAVVATGLAVTGGLVADSAPVHSAAALSASGDSGPVGGLSQKELDERQERVSRSSDDRDRRTADPRKAHALSSGTGKAVTRSADLSTADPKTLAKVLMPKYGLSAAEFGCLDNIWSQESGWNTHAANPTSSAYGIPQALPGTKMSSAGPNWQNNAETQIRWGLGYIHDRYGSACAAWSYKQGAGWY